MIFSGLPGMPAGLSQLLGADGEARQQLQMLQQMTAQLSPAQRRELEQQLGGLMRAGVLPGSW